MGYEMEDIGMKVVAETLEMAEVDRSNFTYVDKSYLKVLLVESNSSVRQVLEEELSKDNHVTAGCANSEEANQAINQQMPDLIIIGYLANESCFEMFREYSKWKFSAWKRDLPIILLSHTAEVNPYYRDWVISKGGYDVLSFTPSSIQHLRERLKELIHQPMTEDSVVSGEGITPLPEANLSPTRQNLRPPGEPETLAFQSPPAQPAQTLNYQQTLAILNQITECSMRFFGGLVIGNYWKKTHVSLVQEHPWLQCWSVNYTGMISYSFDPISEELLSEKELESLKIWVKAFIRECDRVIADYAELLQQAYPRSNTFQLLLN
jgi:DNA-binding response OmpR family regulator